MTDSTMMDRHDIERAERWRKWAEKIPNIQFPSDWNVRIVPPYCGAMARFYVQLPNEEGIISIYLDVFERLGYYEGEPYWEVYPYLGDVGRCPMEDVKELLRMIEDRRDIAPEDADS